MTTKEEALHLSRVAELGCIICGMPAECHHIRSGVGMGKRSSHFEVLALCPTHHRLGGHGIAIHAGRKTWEAKFGSENDLLKKTLLLLNISNV